MILLITLNVPKIFAWVRDATSKATLRCASNESGEDWSSLDASVSPAEDYVTILEATVARSLRDVNLIVEGPHAAVHHPVVVSQVPSPVAVVAEANCATGCRNAPVESSIQGASMTQLPAPVGFPPLSRSHIDVPNMIVREGVCTMLVLSDADVTCIGRPPLAGINRHGLKNT